MHGSGGQGIAIGPDALALARPGVVVQPYLDRPFLVDGRKNHIRLYLLVTSAQPLRAYLYDEGVVRLASERYAAECFDNTWMHITNTGLNETHPNFWLSDDPNEEDTGSARSLSALLRHMAAAGHDPSAVRERLGDLAANFLRCLADDGMFERQAQSGPPHSFPPKLIGLDVLMDADGRPWLLEMQTSPGIVPAAMTRKLHAELCTTIFRMTAPAHGRDVELANAGRFGPLPV